MLFRPSFTKSYSCHALCLAIPLLLATTPMTASAQPYVITDSGSPYRTAVGFQTLRSNTTGAYNTASGYQALFSNTRGSYNTATGYQALFYNKGNQNILNPFGSYNTATGYQALFSGSGYENTATGYQALFSSSGVENTATGYQALFSGSGNQNTATGWRALRSNSGGSDNTATGVGALYANTTGSQNTASGESALGGDTTGSNNIAIGYFAGEQITTTGNNIDIGNIGVSGDSGVIRIGCTDYTTCTFIASPQTSTFIAGINGVTASAGVPVFINASGQLGTVTSSKRFKKDIHTLGTVSDKLLDLRPVSFRYKEAAADGTYPIQYGLIAEEVAKVYPDLVQYDKDGKPFTIYYHLLTPLLLSEVQKEHQQNVTQQAELASFKQRDAQQQAELASLKRRDTQHEAELTSLKQQFVVQMASFKQTIKQLTHLVQTGNSASLTRPQVRNVKL